MQLTEVMMPFHQITPAMIEYAIASGNDANATGLPNKNDRFYMEQVSMGILPMIV